MAIQFFREKQLILLTAAWKFTPNSGKPFSPGRPYSAWFQKINLPFPGWTRRMIFNWIS